MARLKPGVLVIGGALGGQNDPLGGGGRGGGVT